MGAGGTGGNLDRRFFDGIDRGFIFFENSPGVPWRGITDLEETEEDFRIETYYVDGKKVGQSHISGTYSASLTSYDDPIRNLDLSESIFGLSYREHYNSNGQNHYRLHIVQGLTIKRNGSVTETVNVSSTPTLHSWEMSSIDVDLGDNTTGSHIILDSSIIYEWLMRDIENILYGSFDDARIPSIDEIYEIFATMNLVIIDHGDGTWSAVGHETMIRMLDSTEFEINTPSAEYVDEETYDIESLIRDDRWVDQTETDNASWMPPAKDPFRDEDPMGLDEE